MEISCYWPFKIPISRGKSLVSQVDNNHNHMVWVPSHGVRKGAWTEEEDVLLRKCIEKYGEGNWRQVPIRAGLNRCRKSCRLRWLNYLQPNIKRGEFTPDEIDLIVRMHKLLGNRWSLIAGRLPGRTANDVKNYWNSHLHKRHLPSRFQSQQENNNIIRTTVIKPQPRTFSKNSHWLRKRNEKLSSNIGEISNKNSFVTHDQGTPWWEAILFDNEESSKDTDPLTRSCNFGVESSNPCLGGGHISTGSITNECFGDINIWDLLLPEVDQVM